LTLGLPAFRFTPLGKGSGSDLLFGTFRPAPNLSAFNRLSPRLAGGWFSVDSQRAFHCGKL
jgi:hypothetical protein